MNKRLLTEGEQPVVGNSTGLRHRAEQRLANQPRPNWCEDIDMQVLVRELQIHQIELEMQNEALIESRNEAEILREHYSELYDFAPVATYSVASNGDIRQSNIAGARLLGVERLNIAGRPLETFIAPEFKPAFGAFMEKVFNSQDKETCEVVLNVGDNTTCVIIEAIADPSRLTCRLAMLDITEHKRDAEAMQLASAIYKNSNEGMMVTDPDGVIIAINPAFTASTGYTAEDAVGKTPKILNSGRQDKAFYQSMWQSLNTLGRWQGEVWNRRKNGQVYLEWLNINTIYGLDGAVLRRVAQFTDITQKKESEALIRQQANYDELTQLPNRHMFYDRLDQEIKKVHRTGLPLALLFIDLDNFKKVNDTLGHAMGDILLKDAAMRLSRCVRETDTVARLGGDEFVIIMGELEDPSNIERVARGILSTLTVPFQLNDHKGYVSASIGITVYPEDASNIDDLIRNADQAMYLAKNTGRNNFCYFTQSMQDAAQNRMQLIDDLHEAIAEQQFRVHYQPIVELATNSIHKAEALICWQHPERGLIGPTEFIPLTEETGLINGIGDWVFREITQQVAQWRTSHHPEFQISLNKSPVQFHGADGNQSHLSWPEHLQSLGLPGKSVVVEITEGILLDAGAKVVDQLLKYSEAGIQISLDDFGTGYSSISCLQKFKIDYLKIDQSFVHALTTDATTMVASCEAIIVMAHKLDIQVIAEGVETAQQRDLLISADCDFAQGYLFSKPLPAQEFDDWLSHRE